MTSTDVICGTCEHFSNDHRLDDSLNLDPTDPATPFRCIIEGCECPAFTDYAGDVVNLDDYRKGNR